MNFKERNRWLDWSFVPFHSAFVVCVLCCQCKFTFSCLFLLLLFRFFTWNNEKKQRKNSFVFVFRVLNATIRSVLTHEQFKYNRTELIHWKIEREKKKHRTNRKKVEIEFLFFFWKRRINDKYQQAKKRRMRKN